MQPMKLHFDVRDIFRAPRLALGGKKIWILLQANLVGYVSYFVLTHLSFLLGGWSIREVWVEYGLYPCLMGNDSGVVALVIWLLGCLAWFFSILLGATAVARVTYKQLKGDEFYSSGDAWKFVKKHWHAPVFTHLSIAVIALFFVVMAAIFALIGKIPFLGELFFGIPYLFWFFGSVFVAYTTVVLVVSIFFTHAVVGTMEEDTMGAVFQNYSITWSQPWRTLLYLPLIYTLVYAGMTIFSSFMCMGYGLINIVFGHDSLMGSKLHRMVSWASDMVLEPISPITQAFNINDVHSYLPDASQALGPMEYFGAVFVALSLFLIVSTVLSYGLSVKVVAQTIAVVIFRMKTDEENLLERKDEEELELENEDDWSLNSDSSTDDAEEDTDESDDDESNNDSDEIADDSDENEGESSEET